MSVRRAERKASPLTELARVLVRFDHFVTAERRRKARYLCADEKLTAFLELESAIRGCGELFDTLARFLPNSASPSRS